MGPLGEGCSGAGGAYWKNVGQGCFPAPVVSPGATTRPRHQTPRPSGRRPEAGSVSFSCLPCLPRSPRTYETIKLRMTLQEQTPPRECQGAGFRYPKRMAWDFAAHLAAFG